MKTRPILFSSPMVRALLSDSKSQTRRVATFTNSGYLKEPNGHRRWHRDDPDAVAACPYGKPGDLLWVRETWCHTGDGAWTIAAARMAGNGRPIYRADGESDGVKWWPAIHMPREFSRLTLRITDVRVQRLQDISEDDAIAEGVDVGAMNAANCASFRAGTHSRLLAFEYRSLWKSINGPGSWDANPWVWALTFDVIKANVDQVKS